MSAASSVAARPSAAGRPPFSQHRRAVAGAHPGLAWGLRIGVIALVLVLWELIGRSSLLPDSALPPFSAVLVAFFTTLGSAAFWTALLHTLGQWAGGLALAIVLGIPLGLLIGARTRMFRYSRTAIDFLRTIPPIMLLPLFVLMMGTGADMVILLALYAAIWPILVQTISGVQAIDPLTLDTAKVFHISPRRRFTHILLPAVSPFFFSGLRVSAVISLFIAIACELLAGSPGLGQLMITAQQSGDAASLYADILITAVIGLLINGGVGLAESRVLSWHESQRKEAL